jgi:hypothetical protein
MDVTHVPFPNYLMDVLPSATYAHLGECGEWDKHGGDGSPPPEWRCGPSASPCDNEGATGEPDCLVGHLVKPPVHSWMDFDPSEPPDGIKDIVGPKWYNTEFAGGSGPLSPFWAYYAPGQPESECWDKIIAESMDCDEFSVSYIENGGYVECGGVPGSIPSPEPSYLPEGVFYTLYDHDYLPGYIRVLPVGPFYTYEECTPTAEMPEGGCD